MFLPYSFCQRRKSNDMMFSRILGWEICNQEKQFFFQNEDNIILKTSNAY